MLANGKLKDLVIYSFKDYEIALKYFCVCILLHMCPPVMYDYTSSTCAQACSDSQGVARPAPSGGMLKEL